MKRKASSASFQKHRPLAGHSLTLIFSKFFLVVCATLNMVQIPAALSLVMSCMPIPCCCKSSTESNDDTISCANQGKRRSVGGAAGHDAFKAKQDSESRMQAQRKTYLFFGHVLNFGHDVGLFSWWVDGKGVGEGFQTVVSSSKCQAEQIRITQ